MVYENCRFYGPYLNKKDNRLRCVLVHPDGRKQTVSYPKYLMEVQLDRYLEDSETIDHKDGNPLNNDLANLQVLDRRTHCSNDVYRNKDVVVTCQYCGKEFVLKGSRLNDRNRKDRNQSGYFCSRSCSGKYGREVQLGLISPVTVDRVIPDKYQVKSAQEETLEVEAG